MIRHFSGLKIPLFLSMFVLLPVTLEAKNPVVDLNHLDFYLAPKFETHLTLKKIIYKPDNWLLLTAKQRKSDGLRLTNERTRDFLKKQIKALPDRYYLEWGINHMWMWPSSVISRVRV